MIEMWLPLIILLGGLFFSLILGLPMAFSLASCAIITAFAFLGPAAATLVGISTYGMMIKVVIVAMPLFVFMAAILEKSGIADALYSAMHQWLGPLRGGLAIGTVLICTIIAAMSGVAAAGCVTMGLIALPIMLKKGYNKSIAIGPIMAGGALGLLIPPSVSFIIYGMVTKTSIGRLFAGGLIPGLILSFFYMSYIGIRCYLQPHLGPALPPEERGSIKEKIFLSRGLILPILLILSVLGSIFAGIASPTEAAAVGAFGAIVCTFINRRFSWQMIKEACYRTVAVNGMVMWIIFGAAAYAGVFLATGGPKLIKDLILGMEVAPIIVILFMMITYFIMGCFINELTILLVTIPVFFPIVVGLGYDPVWFGVLFLINVQMAMITPPFGYCLFYMRGVAPPNVTLVDIYRSVIPFVILQWVALLLVMFSPQLALWLPNTVFQLR